MLRRRRRTEAMLLCLAICLCLTAPAFAAGGEATVTVGSAWRGGDTVSLSVGIENNPGFAAFNLEVSAGTGLTLTDASAGALLSSGGYFDYNGNYLTWAGSGNVTGDGTLFTLTFSVGAEFEDSAAVTLALGGAEGGLFINAAKADVPVRFVPGAVTEANWKFNNFTTGGTPAAIEALAPAAGNFTITCAKACAVAYSADGGETYVRLDAEKVDGAETSYAFTLPTGVPGDVTIAVALRGDVTGDGALDVGDLSRLRGILLGADADALETVIADLDGDGNVTFLDVLAALLAITGRGSLAW